MGTLEKVIELKKGGASEGDIISKLKTEGISPMEINDSLNQAKIKEAVEEKNPVEGMQPSIMEDETAPAPEPISTPAEGVQAQAPESISQDEYTPQPPATTPNYPPQEYSQAPGYGPQERYYEGETYGDEYEQPQGMGGGSTDTMIEISEQVFSEKIKGLSKELRSLIEFKTIYSSRIDDINERVKRMEKMFDKMQISVLDKVGNFGKNINYLKKEIEMVEDSFSKMHKK